MERVADTTEYEGKNFTSNVFAGAKILLFGNDRKYFRSCRYFIDEKIYEDILRLFFDFFSPLYEKILEGNEAGDGDS